MVWHYKQYWQINGVYTVDAIAMLLPVEIAQIAPIHKDYKIDKTS